MERRVCFLLASLLPKRATEIESTETKEQTYERPTPHDSTTSQAEVAEEISNCK